MQIRFIQCKKEHLYDKIEFKQCPICKQAWFDSNKEKRKAYFLARRDKRLATSEKWNKENKQKKAAWNKDKHKKEKFLCRPLKFNSLLN
jgi:Zn-finger nucleic acid-binding protein